MCFLYPLDRFSSNAAYIYVLVIDRLSSLVKGVGIGKSSPLLCDMSWFLRPKGLVYEKSKTFDGIGKDAGSTFSSFTYGTTRDSSFWFFQSELLVKVALKTCTPKQYTRINNCSDSTTISIWFWLNQMGLYWVKCTFVRKKMYQREENVCIYLLCLRTNHLGKS